MWLCGFGKSESTGKSADTSQTQAVGKSSVKSGTKGFTGLKGIRLTLSEPQRCVCLCAKEAQDVVFVVFLIALLQKD